MKRRVILLGPPGSGKGTIAARLKSEFGFNHVSSGHLLRCEVQAGSETGQRAKVYLDRGELVPDDTVLEMMERWMASMPPEQGFLSDGFPRTIWQAETLDRWLEPRNLTVNAVLFCDCSERVILKRITGRRTCGQCGRGFHVESLRPKQDGKCDDCGSGLVQRDDDTAPVVAKRFEIYTRETEPLVKYYQAQGKLAVVNADEPAETMFAATMAALR